MRRLLCMSRVALADRHDPDVVGVSAHAGHILNAGAFKLVPCRSSPKIQIHSDSTWPQRRLVFDNGIVAMIHGVDPNDGLRLSRADGAAGVIAGPFTKGSLVARLFTGRRNFPFDGDLGMGRYRQSGDRAFDNIERSPTQSADKIQFRPAPGNFRVGGHESKRILAEGRDNRTALSPFPVATANDLTVLTRAHPQPQEVSLVKLHAVGSHVDVAALRILVDEHITGADIASAVGGMASKHGKF